MSDSYAEYIEIPDGTPQEMMAFMASELNKARAETRQGISQRYGELMDVEVAADWKVEFKGTHFLILDWRTVKHLTKEEFFNEDEI